MTNRMPVLSAIVAGVVALACSCTGPKTPGPASTTASPEASGTVSAAPTGPASTAPADRTCHALALAQKPGSSGASGRIAIVIELTNISASTCELNGFPTFQLLSGITTLPMGPIQHGGTGPAPLNASPVPVTLPPRDKAGFLLMYSNRTATGDSCPSANTMTLTSPGPFSGTVDLVACGGQPMNVSPYVYAARLPSF